MRGIHLFIYKARLYYRKKFSPIVNHKTKKWRALYKKFVAINGKDKIRLFVRITKRLVGIPTCLALGGYYIEEDFSQQRQDKQIYVKQRKGENTHNKSAEEKAGLEIYLPDEHKDMTEELCRVLQEKKSYIAIMVECLDKGGLEEVVQVLAYECKKRGIEIKVFCTKEGGEIAKELSESGVEVIVFHGKRWCFERYINSNPPLLVNTHFVTDFFDILHRKNIPIVEVIHNMYVFLTESRIEIEKRKALLISRYVAVSNLAKEIFMERIMPVEKDKIVVISNAIGNKSEIEEERDKVREKLEIDRNAFVCLFVGSMDPRKNQLGILRVWDIVRRIINQPATLVLVGGCSDYEYQKKVFSLLKRRKFGNSVKVLGHSNEIFSLMNAADMFFVDSYFEGWSMAATEALYNGLPLVHSDCGSGKELVDNGRFGVLINNPLKNIRKYTHNELYNDMHAGVNHNIDEAVSAILDIYEHKDEWKKRREEISLYAKKKFSLDRMINQYIGVFLDAYVLENE